MPGIWRAVDLDSPAAMRDLLLPAAFVLLAYLLGSVCFGYIFARRLRVDLRAVGSGNVGATNVGRALGPGAGRWVLVLDAAKGLAVALAARLVFGVESAITAGVGVAVVIGHVLPIWHRFRGGKGAATSVGVLLAIVPWAGAAAAFVFLALKRATGLASLGSLVGAWVGALLTYVLLGVGWPFAMADVLLVIILVRHLDNIERMLRRQEPPS